mmetsp:Transcript_35119/g.76877  ORF Transcript_35119/g.76877 Transcript_35119/m.76877 type:complete len:339 (-) Transcript_35119:83-1099(-)
MPTPGEVETNAHAESISDAAASSEASTPLPGAAEQAVLGGDDTGESLWFFAIGAMVNPVSLQNRKIFPIHSRPAQLLNHRINFFGSIGVAEAVPECGASFHGVLHKVNHDTMEQLDKIERDYSRRNAIARCYDGTEIACVVYCRPHNLGVEVDGDTSEEDTDTSSSPNLPVDQPPLERYLEILILGCEHFGVSEEYIRFLRAHDRQPRPTPDEFQSYGDPPSGIDAPTLKLEEVEKCDGMDGRPLRITSNGRVLECTLDRDSSDWDEFVALHKQVGHVGEIYISRIAYDPKYGLPEKLEDFSREHSAYLEDMMLRYMRFTGLPNSFAPVAWFEQSYRD